MGGVIPLIEGRLQMAECFTPAASSCPLNPVRRLAHSLREAARALMAALDGLRLAGSSASRGRRPGPIAAAGALNLPSALPAAG